MIFEIVSNLFNIHFIERHLNSRWMKFRINGKNTGAYSFQNSFFYLQFPDDSIVYSHENSADPALRATLITQRKTRRFALNIKFNDFPFRRKSFSSSSCRKVHVH